MAPFNPDVPKGSSIGNDPSYLGYSKAISQPEGDKTIGTAIAGIGNLVEQGAKSVDIGVRDIIDRAVHNDTDTIRDAYTVALDNTKSAVTGQPTNDPGNPLNILSDAQTQPPSSVQNGIGGINSLTAAFGAGKISPTYYYGLLNAKAKELRSQFPGWRDYIDQQISQTTGGNPANEYIRSITADINNQLGLSKTLGEKQLSYLLEHSNVDGGANYQAVLAGRKSPVEAIADIAGHLTREHAYNTQILENNTYKSNREVQGDLTKQTMVSYASKYVADSLNTALTTSGATPNKINDILTQAASGNIQIDGVQKDNLIQMLNAKKVDTVRKLKAKFDTVDPNTHQSQSGIVGSETRDSTISSAVKLYDDMIDMVTNDKYGMALAAARQSKALLDQTRLNTYTDPKIGNQIMKMNIANHDGGPEASKLLMQKFILGDTFAPNMQEWAKQAMTGFMAQSDLRVNGNIDTVLKRLNQAQDVAKRNNTKVDPKVADALVSLPSEVITNSKIADPVKLNVAAAAYDPSNKGLFDTIQKDSVDDRGRPVPGRMSAYNKLFSPEVTKQMHRLGQNDQRVWATYKDRAETAFGSEIFNHEINDLNNIAARPDVKLTWDTTNHRWNLQASLPNRPMSAAFNDYEGLNQAKSAINRLNMGIYNLSKIAEASGEDVDAYVLNLMIGMGFDPTKAPGTIPEQMIRSLATARGADALRKAQ